MEQVIREQNKCIIVVTVLMYFFFVSRIREIYDLSQIYSLHFRYDLVIKIVMIGLVLHRGDQGIATYLRYTLLPAVLLFLHLRKRRHVVSDESEHSPFDLDEFMNLIMN